MSLEPLLVLAGGISGQQRGQVSHPNVRAGSRSHVVPKMDWATVYRADLAVNPHDGPTSKADNLNWIYQRMLMHEQEHAVRFDMILTGA